MDEKTFNHHFLVCDITEECIIGQDFLLKFVDKIDYKCLRVITELGDVSCWIGGEAEMISRVTVRRTTQLQANTVTWVPIHVLKSEFLAEDGIIEVSHKVSETKRVCLLSEIINTRADDKYIQSQPIHRCASVIIEPEIPAIDQLPDHLKDMFERSSTELEPDEKETFAKLLLKYQNIFSKTPDDIGKTDRVQHRINTGQALPVRQPPRRQPIGKCAAEKSELEKMLQLEEVQRDVDSDEDSDRKLIELKPASTQCEVQTDKKLGCSDTTVQVKSRAITRNQAVDKESALSVRQELLCGWEPSEVRNRQLKDPNIAPIMVAIDDGCARPEWQRISENPSSLKNLWRQWDRRLELHGRMLYRRWFDDTNDCSKLQVIVPEALKRDALDTSMTFQLLIILCSKGVGNN
ncbi:hypothetical protein CHS0354_002814 [Potamilus streckersoni]|uniref:Uncharacterized protein n=1 Tax=Potamilus streckersoni TaxID=2493646 RepID=A0AAE0RMM8_9BIVA|nr:hypothetical protein CHS0354_002814 [Potamilus streckersoni]